MGTAARNENCQDSPLKLQPTLYRAVILFNQGLLSLPTSAPKRVWQALSWLRLRQQANRQEVTNDTCQID